VRDNPAAMGSELVATVDRRLLRAAVIANGSGAFDTFVFLSFLLPYTVGTGVNVARQTAINAAVFVAYMVVTLILGRRWGRRDTARLASWVGGDRPPTEEERQAALRLPLRQAVLAGRFWVGGALLFGAINAFAVPLAGAIVAFTLLLGGISTTAVNYLIAERVLRPVTARALASQPPERTGCAGVAGRIMVVWAAATGVPLFGIALVGTAGVFADMDKTVLAAAVLFLSVLAAASGLYAQQLSARTLGDSLGGMRDALARIQDADFAVEVEVDDGSELGLLQAGFNQMAAGLREREHLQDLFGRHVGRDVATAALDSDSVELGGEAREVGVLIVDLVGSTGMALRLPPERVVALLNRFFEEVVRVVESHGGSVNKFQGDGALCVFGAPVSGGDPAGDALSAARELRARLADVVVGIGVSAGEAVAGNVGAEERYEYTVIGDPVNEAARLSELAKTRPQRVVASDAALARAGEDEQARWSLGEAVTLRGRSAPTRLATIAIPDSARLPDLSSSSDWPESSD
jgi:adenylate cyclase